MFEILLVEDGGALLSEDFGDLMLESAVPRGLPLRATAAVRPVVIGTAAITPCVRTAAALTTSPS